MLTCLSHVVDERPIIWIPLPQLRAAAQTIYAAALQICAAAMIVHFFMRDVQVALLHYTYVFDACAALEQLAED